MDRAKVENVLIKMGMPTSIKGFSYITDAMEIFGEKGTCIKITTELYATIAKRNSTTASSVERAIRHALEIVRSRKEAHEVVNKYIGFANCANSNSLTMLYKRMREEFSEEGLNTRFQGFAHADWEAEIRKIVRQELAEAMDGR